MRDSHLIQWMQPNGNATARLVGGKALGLQLLATFGLPTPPAFCLTVEAQRSYLRAAGYEQRLAELTAELPDPDAREQLQAMAYEAPWPEKLQRELTAALQHMSELAPVSMLAVRSSAVGEDGAGRSFAGQHDTVLGVLAQGVETAVRVCWASLWSQRAIAYREAQGVSFPCSEMGVVVQELVNADTSAIAFSLDPVSGRRDRVMITVTHGLCEAIVSGTVNPDTAVLEKDSLDLLTYEQGDKAICVVPRAGGGVIRMANPSSKPAADLTSLHELATLVVAAERQLGVPVDVEAARDSSGWRLVQLRPALLESRDPAAQAEAANEPEVANRGDLHEVGVPGQ